MISWVKSSLELLLKNNKLELIISFILLIVIIFFLYTIIRDTPPQLLIAN